MSNNCKCDELKKVLFEKIDENVLLFNKNVSLVNENVSLVNENVSLVN